MSSIPRCRSACNQRKASCSARRTPVTMVSQTKVPQSSSSSQAAAMIRAAFSGLGGSGCDAAVAPRPAAPQLRVELLEYLSGDFRDGHSVQCWPDVAADVDLVTLASRLVQVGNSQPCVKRRAESRLRARVALLVDLG